MPATTSLFIPFRLLSPSHPEYTKRCPAYTNNGNGKRCTTKLKEAAIPEIEKILEGLQSSREATSDDENDETRKKMLQRLATLTVCGHQSKCEEEAVHQWESELRSQDNANASRETPLRNANALSFDDKESPKLEFTPYQTTIDQKVTDKLSCLGLGRGNREMNPFARSSEKRGYLYIFECEEAEGMCKLGHTENLPERTRSQENCYPNLTEKLALHCPVPEVFERVVQLELTQHRYKHKCLKCNKVHTEWFKTNLDNLSSRVQMWCLFSRGLQSSEKRSQVVVPSPGFSSDPDRWYKWAEKYVQEWDKKVSHPEPNISSKSVVDNAIVTGEGLSRLNLDDDAESVPEFSPSSSALGSSDPIERPQNGKPILGQRLIIPATSPAAPPSVSPEVYLTPVERMPSAKGRVLFPRVIPGAYPVCPAKVLPKETKEYENEVADILGSTRLF